MQVNIIANVIGSSVRAGKKSDGSYDNSIFGGYYVKALQFVVDKDGSFNTELLDAFVSPDVCSAGTPFELLQSYEFTIELKEFKNGLRKEIVAFHKIAANDKHTKLTFDLGKVV